MNKKTLIALGLSLSISGFAQAGKINFENGTWSEGVNLTQTLFSNPSIAPDDGVGLSFNTLTSTSYSRSTANAADNSYYSSLTKNAGAYVAEIGGSGTAFWTNGPTASSYQYDQPMNWINSPSSIGGDYFLTDNLPDSGGEFERNHYLINFTAPVSSFSILLYDFNGGGNGTGGTKFAQAATLAGFSEIDAFGLLEAETTFIVDPLDTLDTLPGRWFRMMITAANPIYSVVLNTREDNGTGIDNIEYTKYIQPTVQSSTVPEPLSILLLLAGLPGFVIASRARS